MDTRFFTDPFFDINRKLQLILTMGQLTMENGGNTNHIRRYMMRGADFCGIPREDLQVHIVYDTIMLHITDSKGYNGCSCFRKVTKHVVNMGILASISKLTWRALKYNYTVDEFEEALEEIKQQKPLYPLPLIRGAICFASASLTLLFGGSALAALITVISTFFGLMTNITCQRLKFNIYVCTALAAFVASFITGLAHFFFPEKQVFLYSMISCTLFMIPGIPMINAVDDFFNNHIVPGLTRFTHTIMTIGAITFGIAMAQYFLPVQNFTKIGIIPHDIYALQLIAAATAPIGFSIFFNVEKRLLPYIAIGGVLCVLVRNTLLINYHFFPPAAVFMGAATVGILMTFLASRLRTSSLILAIPSVIPLIPGVLFYRGLFAFLEINHLTEKTLLITVQNTTIALLIIISTAIGIAVSAMFGRAYFDGQKLDRIHRMIEKRMELIRTDQFRK